MVKDVEEMREGRIVIVLAPLPCVLGEVQRERPIGAQKPEEVHDQARRQSGEARLQSSQGRGSEGHRWLVPQSHRVVHRTLGEADPRLIGMRAFKPPQRLEEVGGPNVLKQRVWSQIT